MVFAGMGVLQSSARSTMNCWSSYNTVHIKQHQHQESYGDQEVKLKLVLVFPSRAFNGRTIDPP